MMDPSLEIQALPKSALSCPAKTCRSPDAPQEKMSPGALTGAGVNAAWTSQARRCTGCGCVWYMDGDRKVLRGYFNNPVLSEGWLPIHS